MSIQARVTCPRCKKVWTVNQGESEVDCNCHTYCEEGTKPGDCILQAYTLNHESTAPFGQHVGSTSHDDDPMHIQYYCATHDRYGYMGAITIPVDWNLWLSRRAPKSYRMIENV